jgi:hypothetical protein
MRFLPTRFTRRLHSVKRLKIQAAQSASLPENKLGAVQSADWWDYHRAPIFSCQRGRPAPRCWHGKVLARTDPTATARQVVEWYELRWQIERLCEIRAAGPPSARGGEPWVQARTTDRLRTLERVCQEWNVGVAGATVESSSRTPATAPGTMASDPRAC